MLSSNKKAENESFRLFVVLNNAQMFITNVTHFIDKP